MKWADINDDTAKAVLWKMDDLDWSLLNVKQATDRVTLMLVLLFVVVVIAVLQRT